MSVGSFAVSFLNCIAMVVVVMASAVVQQHASSLIWCWRVERMGAFNIQGGGCVELPVIGFASCGVTGMRTGKFHPDWVYPEESL